MEDKTRYKYAIVRVKESSVVDFFGLIASQGYSDVSFVSNLTQAIARPDPNDELENEDNGLRDDRVAESEDRCSVVDASQSPSDLNSHLTNHLAMMCNAAIRDSPPNHNGDLSIHETSAVSPTPSLRDLEDIAAAASTDLISNLFAAHPMPFSSKEWNTQTPVKSEYPTRHAKQSPGALQFQTRMKGWQREYIKDVINNGHYPTEEELRDIEQKCDLSRKQVLRFIAKRLVNPNRKPRADWRTDKAQEGLTTEGVQLAEGVLLPAVDVAAVKEELMTEEAV